MLHDIDHEIIIIEMVFIWNMHEVEELYGQVVETIIFGDEKREYKLPQNHE